ncbi:MAG: hypothetical protein IJD06_06855 [Clostridia bacterium]|nr:hypothetical protein [Clostridia bacterium]
MILTETPLEEVLRTGKAEHSTAGERWIREAEAQLGMCICAGYMQAHTQIDLPAGAVFERFIRRKPVPFVRSMILTVYTDSRRCRPFPEGEEMRREKLISLLNEILREEGIAPEYPRLYLPEEMRYYGWNQSRRDSWDFSRVIEPGEFIREETAVHTEKMDSLVLWRILQDSLTAMRRCPILQQWDAELFCGYDAGRGEMAYYLLLPGRISEETRVCLRRDFTAYALELLQKRDCWGVIGERSVSPVITAGDALTPEQRFALYKG